MTREEIIEAIANNKMMPFIQPEQLSEIVDFVIKNYKLSLSSELDEAPKKRLRKMCNLREDLKDEPIEEKLQELREIRAEKDRLDEAAEKAGLKYAPKMEGEAIDSNGNVYATDDVEWPSRCGFIKGFKAGAKWAFEQGETFETIISNFAFLPLPELNIQADDKVIVQIRKC